MDDNTSHHITELEQLLEQARRELECGRLEMAVDRFRHLLGKSREEGDKQFEGEATDYLHAIADSGLMRSKISQLLRDEYRTPVSSPVRKGRHHKQMVKCVVQKPTEIKEDDTPRVRTKEDRFQG